MRPVSWLVLKFGSNSLESCGSCDTCKEVLNADEQDVVM